MRRPPGSARCAKCHASSEGYCCCAQTYKGPTHSEHPQPTDKTQRDTSTETEKPTRFQRTHNRNRQRVGPEQHKRQENMDPKEPVHQFHRIKSPHHDRAIFQTANTHQDAQNPRDCRPLITTHRHPTSRRSRLPSLRSRQNLLDRNQQDTTRRIAPNREDAVTWHTEKQTGHSSRRSTTMAQKHSQGCKPTRRAWTRKAKRHITCHQLPTDTDQRTGGKGKPRTAKSR